MALAGYYDNQTQVCLLCAEGCSRCKSATLCLDCYKGYFLADDNLCVKSCPARYYQPIDARRCYKCPYDCYRCDFNGSCVSCKEDTDAREIDDAVLRCNPKIGFFNNYTEAAASCPASCSSCISETHCLSCAEGFMLTPQKLCLGSCP